MSKLYLDKLERGAKFLEKWPLEMVLLLKRKVLVGEPNPREKPRKQVVIKKIAIPESRGEVKEVAISMTKSSSKITKPTLFDKVVNNSIHSRR